MSKVYSFRLNDDNPREAQAMEVIEAWVEEGYSLRHVMIEALLQLMARDKDENDLHFFLEEIREMINGNDHIPKVAHANEQGLPLSFMEAMKKSARIGLRDQNK